MKKEEQMKPIIRLLMTVLCMATVCGCRTRMARYDKVMLPPDVSMSPASAGNDMAEVRPDRMLIWTAELSIQVSSVSNAVRETTTLVESQGGFVGQKSEQGDQSACLTLRIPTKAFNAAMGSLETLGTVTYKNVVGTDITEQYIDVEARLKNKIALRDRLKQVLEKATDVKDILAIEAELERVQSAIDSMEGRIKSLKGQVDYATVTLRLERRPPPGKTRILGPLGYLFKGLYWGVEKLFVIREGSD
jgi:hypothetical protein